MATDRRRTPATAELAVLALVATATLPMTRLFSDGLGPVALAAIALSVAIATVLRRLPFGAVGSWALSTLVMIWFLSARFFIDTLWGPFPSLDTFVALGEAIRQGAEETLREVAPVEPTIPLLMFATAGIWATVWLIDTALLRLANPVLAVASAVPLFVVPGAVLPSTRLVLELALFLTAAGLALMFDQTERFARLGPAGAQHRSPWRFGAALRILVVALAIVGIMAPALPGFGRAPALAGRGAPGASVYFNPIVQIKPTLDNNRNIELFRVRSSSPTYVRLTALEVFDGEEWRPEDRRQTRPFGSDVSLEGPREPVRQEYVIASLAGPWLPAVYEPVSVFGDDPMVETATDTLLVGNRLEYGMQYSVESRAPDPDVELLDREVDYDQNALGRLVDLPRSLPPRVAEIARDITADTTNPYQAALAIQRHLRRFVYDENIAQGHSFNDILTFLTEIKAGYCEQFAGSMAVLARTLGIPARVAIGFGLGEQVDVDEYRITTRHAHAWVEVWFPQAGWIAFEPTPRGGITRLPEYAPPAPRATQAPPVETTRPSPRESQPEPRASDLPTTPEGSDPREPGGPIRGWVTGLVVVALVIAMVLAGPAIARIRHRRRLARALDARGTVAAHYVDFLDWCASAGLGRSPAETPREHAARLGALAPGDDMPTLVALVDQALYAPPNGLVPEEAARAAAGVRAAIKPQLGRAGRLRAALRWGSLWR